jgi:hypothetical protein
MEAESEKKRERECFPIWGDIARLIAFRAADAFWEVLPGYLTVDLSSATSPLTGKKIIVLLSF